MRRDDRVVQGEVEDAIARGDFDDLPGAGKPLHLPSTHDPDWWIKQRLDEEDVDRDALLPVVVLLRREYEQRDDTLRELPDEQAVRAYADDFTARVREDRAASPMARMLAPEMPADVAVQRWRALRPDLQEPREVEPAPAAEPARRRRRWWWRRG